MSENHNNKKTEIEKINDEIKRLKKQQNSLKKSQEAKIKSENRKKRAHRLIETGALAEKYFNLNNLSISEREELFKMFSTFVNANKPKHLKK